MRRRGFGRAVLAASAAVLPALLPVVAAAHPLGNFSISHYAALRLEPDRIELRYVIDMAEIPTFQEVQETGLVPEVGHPSVASYVAGKAEALTEGLHLTLNGRRLRLERVSSEVIFPPGAGDLPTLKLASLYRANLGSSATAGVNHLRYRDGNFPDRSGWKEVVAVSGGGITIAESSVTATDRSRGLADYPTDLLASPPQELEARLSFTAAGSPSAVANAGSPPAPRPPAGPSQGGAAQAVEPEPPSGRQAPRPPVAEARDLWRLEGNRQGTPRDGFTRLIATRELGLSIVLLSLAVAAGLGALHALEPGHGKTMVAAYLVSARGTAWHALVLGLVVTASHTAGVYLLGAVTLYASRFVVPERLYPWLAVSSGLTIAALGLILFVRRYAGTAHPPGHAHPHVSDHAHAHDHPHVHGTPGHQHHVPPGVSLRELVALGVTGGIVPCPAALVVLLSAFALGRMRFALLLIVAFSIGLAAVLIGIGLLMVYARRLMSRLHGDGPLITRWLPLASSAVVTVLGVGIAIQGLASARIIQFFLG